MAFKEYTGEVIVDDDQPVSPKQKPAATVTEPVAAPSADFGARTEAFTANEEAKVQKEKKQKEADYFGVPEWMVVPASVAAGGALALGAKKGIEAFRNRNAPETVRVDPTFDSTTPTVTEQLDPIKQEQLRAAKARADSLEFKLQQQIEKAKTTVAPVTPTAVPPQANLTPADLAARSASLPVPAPTAAAVVPPVAPTAPTAPAAPTVPAAPLEITPLENPTFQSSTEFNERAKTQPVVGVAPPESPVVETQKAAPIPPADKPKTAKAPKTVPEGTTFRPDLGPGDNTLFNTYGEEGRKELLKKYNAGKPAGSYENALKIQEQYQTELLRPSRRELPKAVAVERGIPPTGAGNYGKLGKAAKIGGIAGLALTATQAAQAAQQKKYGEALGIGLDVFVPPFAGSTEVSSGTLTSPEARELFKRAKPTGAVPPKR